MCEPAAQTPDPLVGDTGARVGYHRHAGRGGQPTDAGCDGDGGQPEQRRGRGRAGDRLLQLGDVVEAPVEGQVDLQTAGRPFGGGDAEREVEPGLGGGHPRGLGRQDEGGPGCAPLLRSSRRGGAQRADQGCDGHRERAEGGPGPARRHRERLEAATTSVGAATPLWHAPATPRNRFAEGLRVVHRTVRIALRTTPAERGRRSPSVPTHTLPGMTGLDWKQCHGQRLQHERAHYRGRVQSTSVPERFRPYVDATDELARRFAAAGHTLYLVGGSVRDALFPGPAPDRGRPRPRSHDRRPARPRSSGWCGAGPTTSGPRASASAPSAAARAPRSTRSRRTGPRSTCPSRASPR